MCPPPTTSTLGACFWLAKAAVVLCRIAGIIFSPSGLQARLSDVLMLHIMRCHHSLLLPASCKLVSSFCLNQRQVA
jgi:hypothetical protein